MRSRIEFFLTLCAARVARRGFERRASRQVAADPRLCYDCGPPAEAAMSQTEAKHDHDSLIYDWNVKEQQHPQKHVSLDDETLRDGLQSPSVTNPKIDEKIAIL